MIAIIDYGLGNLGSMANMLKKIGVQMVVSSDPLVVEATDKLILPGVGSFDEGMKNLQSRELVQTLNKRVLDDKVPILGICLGMQLLSKRSEEGQLAGLGWIDAKTVRFKFNHEQKNLKIPHMGWNTIKTTKETILFNGINGEQRFYFVHSYHVVCKNERDVLAKTFHGYEFVSSFSHENITGVQFHPEKSHKFGMNFLKNWAMS